MDNEQTSRRGVLTYRIRDLVPYINWIYFFHAWGFAPRYAAAAYVHACPSCRHTWIADRPEADRPKAREAMQVFEEADRVLSRLDILGITAAVVYRLCRANADGDDLLLDGHRLPLLRQQVPHADGSPYLCLSDFVRPLSSGVADTVGLFAASVPSYDEAKALFADDPFRSLTVQLLLERLAEAATERMHLDVRRHIWGYAPDEDLDIGDLLVEKFQGIRPAVGYPSIPDLSINFLLDEMLDMHQVGITLTENGMMHPDASTSGLMLAHPAATYFAVGPIGEDQLADYARRRGLPVDRIRQFLAQSSPQAPAMP